MAYKDYEKQKEYCCLRLKRRRREWVAANGPCARCGSGEELEVDHVDPSMKVDHKVWSWSQVRREAELSKCQVLCRACHKKKNIEEYAMKFPQVHGTWQSYARSYNACRCELCTKAWARHEHERRVKKRAERIAV